MKWTDATRAVLRALWDDGHSAAQIAVLLMQRFPDAGECSKNSVVGKVNRSKFPPRASPINIVSGRAAAAAALKSRVTAELAASIPPATPPVVKPQENKVKSQSIVQNTIICSPGRPFVPPRPLPTHYTTYDPAWPHLPHPRRCQWRDGTDWRDWRQCESAQIEHRVYCADHTTRCYIKRHK